MLQDSETDSEVKTSGRWKNQAEAHAF